MVPLQADTFAGAALPHHVRLPAQDVLRARVGRRGLWGQQQLNHLWVGVQNPVQALCEGHVRLIEPGDICLQVVDWHALRDFQRVGLKLQACRTVSPSIPGAPSMASVASGCSLDIKDEHSSGAARELSSSCRGDGDVNHEASGQASTPQRDVDTQCYG